MPAQTLAALVVAASVIVVIAGFSRQSSLSRADGTRALSHTHLVQRQLMAVLSDLQDAETGQRGFLLTGQEPSLEPYNTARTSLPSGLAVLRQLTADNPDQQHHVDLLAATVSQKLDLMAQTIVLQRAGQAAAAIELVRSNRGQVLMDQLRAAIAEMAAVEERLLDERTRTWQDSVTWSSYVTYGGSGVLLAALTLIAWLASRDFRSREAEAWVRRVQMALNTQLQGDLGVASVGEKILGVLVAPRGRGRRGVRDRTGWPASARRGSRARVVARSW